MEPLATKKVGPLETLQTPRSGDEGVVLLFHGFGADAQDLAPLASVYPKFKWVFPNGPLQVPLAPGFTGRAWFEVNIDLLQRALQEGNHDSVKKAFPKELSSLNTLGDNLINALEVPLSKLFIGGFSQGAVLATQLALSLPTTPAGLLILSGTLVNETSWEKLTAKRAGMPFFQSHGHHDPLLPFSMAQDLERLLQQGGLKGHLYPFVGGHEIPPDVLQHLAHFFESFTH